MELKTESELQDLKPTDLYKYIVDNLHPQIQSLKVLIAQPKAPCLEEDGILEVISLICSGASRVEIIKKLVEEV